MLFKRSFPYIAIDEQMVQKKLVIYFLGGTEMVFWGTEMIFGAQKWFLKDYNFTNFLLQFDEFFSFFLFSFFYLIFHVLQKSIKV